MEKSSHSRSGKVLIGVVSSLFMVAGFFVYYNMESYSVALTGMLVCDFVGLCGFCELLPTYSDDPEMVAAIQADDKLKEASAQAPTVSWGRNELEELV